MVLSKSKSATKCAFKSVRIALAVSTNALLIATLLSFNLVFTFVIESVKANLTANIESFNLVFTLVIESTNALLIAKEVSTIACLFTFIRLLNDMVSKAFKYTKFPSSIYKVSLL